ncbi:hypothetical protein B0T21DRAFT_139725 [Apiosordaria backusii]|uniref:Secreted protein n=1 Tax=Apiosordaria backusii TaxID=314023 RepID=A0AA40EF71_9PEZI|nr:hypothetical protein B0T21DRAFT_139725 [Apiosordaria backusii]
MLLRYTAFLCHHLLLVISVSQLVNCSNYIGGFVCLHLDHTTATWKPSTACEGAASTVCMVNEKCGFCVSCGFRFGVQCVLRSGYAVDGIGYRYQAGSTGFIHGNLSRKLRLSRRNLSPICVSVSKTHDCRC